MALRLLFLLVILDTFAGFSKNRKLDSLFIQVQKGVEDSGTVNALNYISRSYRNTSTDTALLFSKKAIEMAERLSYKKGIVQALTLQGQIEMRMGSMGKALACYEKARDLAKQIPSRNEEARAIANIADIYHEQQKLPEAMRGYLEALKIFEEINPNDDKISQINSVLGMLNFDQGNTKRALEYLYKSLGHAQLSSNPSAVAYAHLYIGNIHGDLHQFDSSNTHYLASYDFLKTQRDINALIAVISNIGQNCNEMGQYKKALTYFNEAHPLIVELQNRSAEANSLVNIGSSYCNLGEYKEAITNFEKAIRIAKEIGSGNNLKTAFKSMAYALKQKGDLKLAYFYLERHLILKDSLFGEESREQIAEMESKYQNEKKELQIKNLEAEQELKASEVKKERLMKYVGFGGLGAAIIIGILLTVGLLNKKRDNRLIKKQKEEVELKSSEIEHQKHILSEKNNEITDSINYAKRLQLAILPSEKQVNELFENNFILYKPKDIVAGDFYWFEKMNDLVFFAAADCTGHGVPGAMVSVVCSNALNRSVLEFAITDPGKILDKTRELVIATFSKSGENVRDGMDISLCCFDTKTNELSWAGANNPLLIFNGNELIELHPDKQPIAKYEHEVNFNTQHLKMNRGNVIYAFTDGYADQFGGPKGKKFKYKNLFELLGKAALLPMNEQKELLNSSIEKWKGDIEQVDDICILGVKV